MSSRPEPRQVPVSVLVHQGTSSPSLVLDAKWPQGGRDSAGSEPRHRRQGSGGGQHPQFDPFFPLCFGPCEARGLVCVHVLVCACMLVFLFVCDLLCEFPSLGLFVPDYMQEVQLNLTFKLTFFLK